jgi:hypothetical protein
MMRGPYRPPHSREREIVFPFRFPTAFAGPETLHGEPQPDIDAPLLRDALRQKSPLGMRTREQAPGCRRGTETSPRAAGRRHILP